jgi:glutathionyl-hydroquinone reductase
MGVLINDARTGGELPQGIGDNGRFKRADSQFRDRVTAGGSSGFKAKPGATISMSCTVTAFGSLICHANSEIL